MLDERFNNYLLSIYADRRETALSYTDLPQESFTALMDINDAAAVRNE